MSAVAGHESSPARSPAASAGDWPSACACGPEEFGGRVDPIGSAPTHDLHLFVEVPLPWSGMIGESRRFPQAVRATLARAWREGTRARLLGVAPDPSYSVPGHTRVLAFRRPAGPFALLDREEFLIPAKQVAALVEALLLRPERLTRFAPFRLSVASARDLFVCTHGAHDPCCGTLGEALYAYARQTYTPEGTVRVWRTSHMGGYRFAPTLLDLPEGRGWAYITPPVLDRIVRRSGPVGALIPCYRGWAGLETAFEQALEREAFVREGWDWIDYAKQGQVVAQDATGREARVRIAFRAPNNGCAGVYEAVIRVMSTAPDASSAAATVEATTLLYCVEGVVRRDLVSTGG